MLQDMASHDVLVKQETEFGDEAYVVGLHSVKFNMVYVVKSGSLAANTGYISLAEPRTNILKYPKLALIMKLAVVGWQALKPSELRSEYELEQAKVFDCRSSRQFARIIFA